MAGTAYAALQPPQSFALTGKGLNVRISIIPEDGWANFESSKSIETLIWETLKCRDIGGAWEYHSFTSNSSFWCNGGFSLALQFEDDECKKVQNIELVNPVPQSAELNQLVELFEKKYGLISNLC